MSKKPDESPLKNFTNLLKFSDLFRLNFAPHLLTSLRGAEVIGDEAIPVYLDCFINKWNIPDLTEIASSLRDIAMTRV